MKNYENLRISIMNLDNGKVTIYQQSRYKNEKNVRMVSSFTQKQTDLSTIKACN